MVRPGGRRLDGERGYVLVLVLAILVILTILATTVATFSQGARDQQLQRMDELDAWLDMESTRASAIYLMLIQRKTMGGITVDDRTAMTEDERVAARRDEEGALSVAPVGNEVPTDGSVHQGIGRAVFAISDDSSRVAVNWAPPVVLERVLGLEADRDLPFATLFNRLQDYQDADHLVRLNSMERDEYAAAGLPPPSNRTLLTALELRRVGGWGEILEDWSDQEVLDYLTLARSTRINANTAPVQVISALPGVDEAGAERVVDARRFAPFLRERDVGGVAGSPLVDEDYVRLYPLTSGTLEIWVPGAGPSRFIHWTLTPRDEGGRPWRENYEILLPQREGNARTVAKPVESAIFAEPLAVSD